MKLWVTVFIPSYEDMIVAALVRNGYSVSRQGQKGLTTVSSPGTMSAVFACSLSHEDENDDEEEEEEDVEYIPYVDWHLKEISRILKEKGVKYYSIVLLDDSENAVWANGDVSVTTQEAV